MPGRKVNQVWLFCVEQHRDRCRWALRAQAGQREQGLAEGVRGCLLGYGGVGGLHCTELPTFLRHISG